MDVVSACLAVLGKRSLDSLMANSHSVSSEDFSTNCNSILENFPPKKSMKKTDKPKPPKETTELTALMVNPGCPGIEWGQKEWMNFVQNLLIFLHETKPDDPSLFCNAPQLVPETFGQTQGVYCFPMKGLVVPVGNADGRVWKPSQGARETGSCMVKRYYYHKDSHDNQIKRQISWLRDFADYTFFDYRSNFRGKVKLSQLMGPFNINWELLVTLVNDHSDKLRSMEASSKENMKQEKIAPTVAVCENQMLPTKNNVNGISCSRWTEDPFMDTSQLHCDIENSMGFAPNWTFEGFNNVALGISPIGSP